MSNTDNSPFQKGRDHGGGLDAAIMRYGGQRADWIDLSTGINPDPYPVTGLKTQDWTALPDMAAHQSLIRAARKLWAVPDAAAILPAPGASALIARLPLLGSGGRVQITTPTYNEHAAAFAAQGWEICNTGPADARVLVHPNNPDGRLWQATDATAPLTIIDESFCDITPKASLIAQVQNPGCVILKSFGKFWGLAGLRLGFAIAAPDVIDRLANMLGPWPVSGPALRIGAQALENAEWAAQTRARLAMDSMRLDQVMQSAGAALAGGTDLFRLYKVDAAAQWQDRLARKHIWSRIFPYSTTYIRLGMPPANGWARIEAAL